MTEQVLPTVMRRLRWLLTRANLCLALGLAATLVSLPAQAVTYYKITDFTKLYPGQPNSGGFTPTAINNNGLVLGYFNEQLWWWSSQYTPTYKLFNSRTGKFSDVHLVNGKYYFAADINNLGQSVGAVAASLDFIDIIDPTLLYIRNLNGSADLLGTFTRTNPQTSVRARTVEPKAINDNGKITFNSVNFNNYIYGYKSYASKATGSGFYPLVSLEGPKGIVISNSLNNRSQVVGWSTINSLNPGPSGVSISHAFISLPFSGKLADLHRANWPKRPGFDSMANSLTDAGMVAGNYTYATGVRSFVAPYGTPYQRAVVWDTVKNTAKVLGDKLTPRKSATLSDINQSNQVVGKEVTYSGHGDAISHGTETRMDGSEHALVGDVASGQLVNLNGVLLGNPDMLRLVEATKINNAGQILAKALEATVNAPHYLLLTPVQVP
ncbi:MAG: hypothetical protein ABL933_06535 [Methyloglobulus sp.]|nr:hypothetical protein [Methyloglobulus sp.]